ncbi:MAG: GntR family transcriptional regulator [Lachnospiraceae bacterium]|nr:GntR family transcriptional regulator [Lachnospiraceae bacterium]
MRSKVFAPRLTFDHYIIDYEGNILMAGAYSGQLTNRERIAETLRRGIYFGDFRPGQELVQNTIAGQLGVSRMPVREAIYILLAEGLVEHIPNRGFFVKKIDRNFFEDYYFVRIIFEQRAVSHICKTLEDTKPLLQLQELERTAYECYDLKRLSQCTDFLQSYERQHCGSPRLADYLKQLTTMSPRRISQTSEDQRKFVDSSFDYHQNLIQAMLDRDCEKTSCLISQHLELSKQYYFSIREQLHLDD